MKKLKRSFSAYNNLWLLKRINFNNVRATSLGHGLCVLLVRDIFLRLWNARFAESKWTAAEGVLPFLYVDERGNFGPGSWVSWGRVRIRPSRKEASPLNHNKSASIYQSAISSHPVSVKSGCMWHAMFIYREGEAILRAHRFASCLFYLHTCIIGRRGCHRYRHKWD